MRCKLFPLSVCTDNLQMSSKLHQRVGAGTLMAATHDEQRSAPSEKTTAYTSHGCLRFGSCVITQNESTKCIKQAFHEIAMRKSESRRLLTKPWNATRTQLQLPLAAHRPWKDGRRRPSHPPRHRSRMSSYLSSRRRFDCPVCGYPVGSETDRRWMRM